MKKIFLIFICLALAMPVVAMAGVKDVIPNWSTKTLQVKSSIQFSISDGTGKATFICDFPMELKYLKKYIRFFKTIYKKNPTAFNGTTWDFRTDGGD